MSFVFKFYCKYLSNKHNNIVFTCKLVAEKRFLRKTVSIRVPYMFTERKFDYDLPTMSESSMFLRHVSKLESAVEHALPAVVLVTT